MLNLVSDSSCDLISGELNSPYARLTVAPMCLHVGGQDYPDTPELDIPALLGMLAHHRSSSACPSPAAYAEAFEQGEETVCVTISSQLSGSYNAAMAALLPRHGVQVREIPRLEVDGQPVSASRVRRLLKEKGLCPEVLSLVPPTTAAYLQESFAQE